jgi:hypothetical protein
MKVKIMLEHTDTITNKDEYIIIDDRVIKEIKQTLKRKLSGDDIEQLDDYQNELNIIKKTKQLSTTPEKQNNSSIPTSFAMLDNDPIPIHTNGYHQDTLETDFKINVKKHKPNNDGKYSFL